MSLSRGKDIVLIFSTGQKLPPCSVGVTTVTDLLSPEPGVTLAFCPSSTSVGFGNIVVTKKNTILFSKENSTKSYTMSTTIFFPVNFSNGRDSYELCIAQTQNQHLHK